MVEWRAAVRGVEVGVAEELSERELEILRLVATGVTNREIAVRLVISPNTVKVHLRNIFAKLGVESRTEATLVAIQNGWVDVSAVPPAEAPPAPIVPPLSWPRRILLVCALTAALALALWPRPRARAPGREDAQSDSGASTGAAASVDSAERWSPKAALPAPKARAACAAHEGLVYLIGGETAQGVVDEVQVYDPATDRGWEARAPKPTAAYNVAACVLGEEIYVPGGSDGERHALGVLEVYRPATDSWRTARELPAPRSGYALAAAGGRVYLFGGWDGARYVADVWIYDPARDAWSRGTPMGQARGYLAAATVEERIYVVGGYDGVREYASCEVYDPALEGSEQSPWRALAPMSQARGGLGLATDGRWLYAIGGGWNGGLAYNEKYDIAGGRWQPFPTPILGRWRTLAVAAVRAPLGTMLYAIGGYTDERVAYNQAYRAWLSIYLPGPP